MTFLLLDPVEENPNTRFHENIPSSFSAGVSAASDDPVLQPGLELAPVAAEIRREQGIERPVSVTQRRRGRLPRIDDGEVINGDQLTPFVEPDELNERYKDIGLKFDKPTRDGVAKIIAREKEADLVRQDILNRAPDTFAFKATSLAASFAAAAIDPVNIASAFIPVAREGRLAGQIARISSTGGQRAARGAAEGAIGNALVEPIVGALSEQQQRDYTMADALLNITLGAGIGAGFRLGSGVIGDRLAEISQELREAAARSSVAQLSEGRVVEVNPVLRESAAVGRAFDEVSGNPIGPVDDPLVRIQPGDIEDIIVQRGPAILSKNGEIKVTGRELAREFGTERGFGLVKIIWRHGSKSQEPNALKVSRSDVTAFPEIVREFEPADVRGGPDEDRFVRAFRVERDGRVVQYEVSRFNNGDKQDHLVSINIDKPGSPRTKKPLSQRKTGEALNPTPRLSGAGVDTDRGTSRRPDGQEPSPANQDIRPSDEEIKNIARREADPANDITGDPEVSARVNEELAKAPREWNAETVRQQADEIIAEGLDDIRAEADFAQSRIDDLRQQGLITEADEKVIDSLQDMLKRAETGSRAAKQLAYCMVR